MNESLLKVPIVACSGIADQAGNAVRIETAGVGRIARGGMVGVEEALRNIFSAGNSLAAYPRRTKRGANGSARYCTGYTG